MILHLLKTLHDPDGVKAGQLLVAVKLCAPRVVERWLIFQRESQYLFPRLVRHWNFGGQFFWQELGSEVSVILGAFPEGQNMFAYDGCCGRGGSPMRERLVQGFAHDVPSSPLDIDLNEIDL